MIIKIISNCKINVNSVFTESYVTTWKHNGNTLTADDRMLFQDVRYTVDKDLKLTINKVLPQDSGKFECIVEKKIIHYELEVEG